MARSAWPGVADWRGPLDSEGSGQIGADIRSQARDRSNQAGQVRAGQRAAGHRAATRSCNKPPGRDSVNRGGHSSGSQAPGQVTKPEGHAAARRAAAEPGTDGNAAVKERRACASAHPPSRSRRPSLRVLTLVHWRAGYRDSAGQRHVQTRASTKGDRSSADKGGMGAKGCSWRTKRSSGSQHRQRATREKRRMTATTVCRKTKSAHCLSARGQG